MSMTIERFLHEIATSGRTWLIKPGASASRLLIRTPRGRCPITAIATGKGIECTLCAFTRPGHELGLSCGDANRIAYAADYPDSTLRQRLLEACNLAPASVADEQPTPKPDLVTV